MQEVSPIFMIIGAAMALGFSVTAVLGGAFSGYFLQTLAMTVVDSTGQINQDADKYPFARYLYVYLNKSPNERLGHNIQLGKLPLEI
jgi:hypothetical protein